MIILADMQKKGVFEIEREVEEQFKVKLEPDDVQSAWERLAGNRPVTGCWRKCLIPAGTYTNRDAHAPARTRYSQAELGTARLAVNR